MSAGSGEQRTLQVPEGLAGERVDVGLARMFGISRSKAAELLAQELVTVDGRAGREVRPAAARRAARRHLPARARPARGARRGGRGHRDHPRRRRHRGRRQARRRRRTPLDGLDRARPSSATCAAPATRSRPAAPRSGAGSCSGSTSARPGVMVIAKSEAAYSRAEERLPAARGRQDLPRARAGPSRPARGHHRRADRSAPRSPTGSSRCRRTASTASPTTRRWRRTGSPACSRCTSRPGAPTRSGCTWRR